MNKLLFAGLALLGGINASAQQKAGKVTYQRTTQMQIVVNDGAGENAMPRTRTEKFELNFANNQMAWRMLDEDLPDDNFGGGGGGVVIRTFGGGGDDVTFCDFNQGRKVEARDFFDKKFLISDSIRKNNWKLSEETKTIQNHLCRKATTERIGKRMQMSMNNGKMDRQEINDTSAVVAWFTTDIPVPAGPEYQGQLPGLILELETNNGKTVYTAIEIDAKADMSSIKEPTKGKKVTQEQFIVERNKMLEEMQKNNGGDVRIRMN